MADPNVAIQKIGLRRMTGVLTTTTVAPAALSAMAYDISGVSEEEMEAYQRSLAPEWEKNARLIFSQWKNSIQNYSGNQQ